MGCRLLVSLMINPYPKQHVIDIWWHMNITVLPRRSAKPEVFAKPEEKTSAAEAVAHNPTGVDPTNEQWQKIVAACKERIMAANSSDVWFHDSSHITGIPSFQDLRSGLDVRVICACILVTKQAIINCKDIWTLTSLTLAEWSLLIKNQDPTKQPLQNSTRWRHQCSKFIEAEESWEDMTIETVLEPVSGT